MLGLGPGLTLLRRLLTYAERVLSLVRPTVLAYWSLDDTSSTARDISGNSRNGSASNVTVGVTGIGDGRLATRFNGTTSVINVYSTSLRDGFSGVTGMASAWVRVSGAGVWTDATVRTIFRFGVDGNNRAAVTRTATNNQIQFQFAGSGVFRNQTYTFPGTAPTGWIHVAMKWSASGVECFVNGRSIAVPLLAATWSGQLASTQCAIGSAGSTASAVWSGDIGHVMLASSAPTAHTIADISWPPMAQEARIAVGSDLHIMQADDPQYDATYINGRTYSQQFATTVATRGDHATIILGDMVQNGNVAQELSDAAAMLNVIPHVHYAYGNHDAGYISGQVATVTAQLLAQFAAPSGDNAMYYALTLGPVRVVVLNSALSDDETTIWGRGNGVLGPTQQAWLTAEIAANTSVPLCLVIVHHPPSGAGFDTQDITDLATILAGRSNVVVMSGHNHPPTLQQFALSTAIPGYILMALAEATRWYRVRFGVQQDGSPRFIVQEQTL